VFRGLITMKSLRLDFAQQPWRRLAERCTIVGVATFALSVCVAGLTAAQYSGLRNGAQRLEHEIERASRRAAQPSRFGKIEAEKIETELRQAQAVRDHLLLPWRDLFTSLESAKTADVALLAVEPTGSKRELRVSGEAKSFEAILTYLNNLGRSPVLAESFLASHEVEAEETLRPVKFAIISRWQKSR
jgi:Tfp pilus assembly protein PilN